MARPSTVLTLVILAGLAAFVGWNLATPAQTGAGGPAPVTAEAPDTPPAATETETRPPSETAARRVPRDVTPQGMHSGPLRVAPPPREAPEAARVRRFARVAVHDPGGAQAGDTHLRFAGIEPLGADETCADAQGATWPCGRLALTALRMLIRHRAIECEMEDDPEAAATTRCTVGGREIGQWLVEQGWAGPAEGSPYAQAGEDARREGRGMHAPRRP